MKCDRCGLQSDVEQAFSTEKRILGGSKHFCPDCTVTRHTRSIIVMMVLLAASAGLLYVVDPTSAEVGTFLQAYLVLAAFLPLIVIHELAHAGVANLLGLRVFGIVIGLGRPVWSGKLFGMDWAVNILPLSAITSVGARPVSGLRWKLFLVYGAGPASHAILAVASFLLTGVLPPWTMAHRLANIMVFANVLLLLSNLFPRKVPALTGMQGTDGWHLLRVPFMKENEITKLHVGYYAGEAVQAYTAHDFEAARHWVDQALAQDGSSGIARNVLGIIQMACGDYRESRETFLKLLEGEDAQQPGLRYILLNNVAYLDALLGDPSLLPEADQYSAEAFKHLQWVPAIVGTRGTVLVELGRLEEGIALLKKSMGAHADKHGKALNACHLAIGQLRLGNLSSARQYLDSAKTLDPRCFLLPRVEAEIVGNRKILEY